MSKKEIIKAKCMQLLFGWECSPCWHKFAHIVELFIMDAFVDLFITLCIVINTMFMAIDHYGMSPELTHTLVTGNYVSAPSAHCILRTEKTRTLSMSKFALQFSLILQILDSYSPLKHSKLNQHLRHILIIHH